MSSDLDHPARISLKCERDDCTKRNSDGYVLRKCSGCRRVYFCSEECQRAWWPSHKALCRTLQNPEARKTLPSYNTVHAAREQVQRYWHGDEPASERIHWFSIADAPSRRDEPHVRRAKEYMIQLDVEQVIQYAVGKFISTKSRGAVVFDFSRPIPIFAGRGQFNWMPEPVAQSTGDTFTAQMVTEYDPAISITIFLYAVESQGRFMHLAGLHPFFGPLPTDILREVEQVKREILADV